MELKEFGRAWNLTLVSAGAVAQAVTCATPLVRQRAARSASTTDGPSAASAVGGPATATQAARVLGLKHVDFVLHPGPALSQRTKKCLETLYHHNILVKKYECLNIY